MIVLTPLKLLTLTQASHVNRHSHFSAASGLVQVGKFLYIVADDENHLGIFPCDSSESGKLRRLLPGDLPLDFEERKVEKPDLEVLTFIPASKKFPHGALLALGSGSRETRAQGVIIAFDHKGELANEVEIIDLTSLYRHLKKTIGKLNIEGAIIVDKEIVLFQRGNKKNNVNLTIRFPLKRFYQTVLSAKAKPKLEAVITHYSLGEIAGVPLCFTDATPLPDGSLVFTAAAENTSDAYLDGACMGSAIGIISSDGKLQSIKATDQVVKLEGVEASVIDNNVHLLLVTDADDETVPAQLYSAELGGYPFA